MQNTQKKTKFMILDCKRQAIFMIQKQNTWKTTEKKKEPGWSSHERRDEEEKVQGLYD